MLVSTLPLCACTTPSCLGHFPILTTLPPQTRGKPPRSALERYGREAAERRRPADRSMVKLLPLAPHTAWVPGSL